MVGLEDRVCASWWQDRLPLLLTGVEVGEVAGESSRAVSWCFATARNRSPQEAMTGLDSRTSHAGRRVGAEVVVLLLAVS